MIKINERNEVTLRIAKKDELPKFKKNLQEAFAVAIVEEFGSNLNEPIPSDKDIEQSFNEAETVIYHIILEGKKVGGAVININELTQHNSLELFFIYKSEHSHGLGYKAWKAIEKQYPETKIWETCTPYFEKRNIHFYVNKCGFKIVEYFNKNNPDPHAPEYEDLPGSEDLFRFEKIMKK